MSLLGDLFGGGHWGSTAPPVAPQTGDVAPGQREETAVPVGAAMDGEMRGGPAGGTFPPRELEMNGSLAQHPQHILPSLCFTGIS